MGRHAPIMLRAINWPYVYYRVCVYERRVLQPRKLSLLAQLKIHSPAECRLGGAYKKESAQNKPKSEAHFISLFPSLDEFLIRSPSYGRRSRFGASRKNIYCAQLSLLFKITTTLSAHAGSGEINNKQHSRASGERQRQIDLSYAAPNQSRGHPWVRQSCQLPPSFNPRRSCGGVNAAWIERPFGSA